MAGAGGRPRVLLSASGSVATVKVPRLVLLLREFADVQLVVTKGGQVFLDRACEYDGASWEAFLALDPPVDVLTDEGEWSMWARVGDPVLHVQLREWADVMLVAPLSANTLAKLANGLCDNLLTCTARAWDAAKPLLVAPAMNTHMWHHPLTARQLGALSSLGVTVIPPVVKTLACGDTGVGGLAEPADVCAAVREALSRWTQVEVAQVGVEQPGAEQQPAAATAATAAGGAAASSRLQPPPV